jgi:WbqC-like protein family
MVDRIGMIHQPHFLPWPGYVARCLAADVFVVLDNVQYKRNHFQQRTKYLDQSGQPRWLSLPIASPSIADPISSVRIRLPFYVKPWQRGIVHAYSSFPLFGPIWGRIAACIESELPSLLKIDLSTLGARVGFPYN